MVRFDDILQRSKEAFKKPILSTCTFILKYFEPTPMEKRRFAQRMLQKDAKIKISRLDGYGESSPYYQDRKRIKKTDSQEAIRAFSKASTVVPTASKAIKRPQPPFKGFLLQF